MLLAMVAAASAIFAAAVIGRPITNKLAPSESACSGVAIRFWSPASDPAGRTPGVIKTVSGPTSARTAATSWGEQTIARAPAATDCEARRLTMS